MKFTPTTKRYSPPSALTHGWHPGYIVRIQEEPKPEFFTMGNYDTALAWYLAIWQRPGDVAQGVPEQHIAYCSPSFNPGGGKGRDGNPIAPSKAYNWVSGALGRPLSPTEAVELAEKKPHPVRIKVQREEAKDYIRVVDFEPWDDAPDTFPASVQALMQTPTPTAPAQPAPVTAGGLVVDETDIPF